MNAVAENQFALVHSLNIHLPLDTTFELMYYWSREMDTKETLMRQIEIESTRTIVDWRNFCRDVCAEYYIRHPLQIGDILHQFIKSYTFIYLQDPGMWLKLTKAALGSVNMNVVDFNWLNNRFSEVLIFKQENVL